MKPSKRNKAIQQLKQQRKTTRPPPLSKYAAKQRHVQDASAK